MPKHNLLEMIPKLLSESMDHSRMQDVWDFLKPPGPISRDTDPEPLDPVVPKMSTISGVTGEELKEVFLSFLLNHKLVGYMSLLDKGLAAVLALAESCLNFLEEHKVRLDIMPTPASWHFVRVILRAVLAVASPTPGIMGSTKEDVQLLAFFGEPEQTRPERMSDPEAEMFVVFKTAVNDQPFWYAKLGRYWKVALADAELGPIMQKLTTDLQEGGLSRATDATEKLQALKQRLRPGATKDLERAVMGDFERFCKVSRLT